MEAMPELEAARAKISSTYIATKSDCGAHTVTFQPLLTRQSEDRIVTESWEIHGQRWIFLAVCDGSFHHYNLRLTTLTGILAGIGGIYAAQNVATNLPNRIRESLIEVLGNFCEGPPDRKHFAEAKRPIASMLTEVIQTFDAQLGQAVQDICPRPEDLTSEKRQALIEEHRETILSAFNATTLSGALLNVTHGLMWAIGVGDSTIGMLGFCRCKGVVLMDATSQLSRQSTMTGSDVPNG